MVSVSAKGFKGDKKFLKQLDRCAKRFPLAVAGALFEEMREIFEGSQAQVPYDTGDLRKSGMLELVRGTTELAIYISYSEPYAFEIHERTELDSVRTDKRERMLADPGFIPIGAVFGKSKFLEDPFKMQLVGIEARAARRARMIIEGSGNPLANTRTVRGKKSGRSRLKG